MLGQHDRQGRRRRICVLLQDTRRPEMVVEKRRPTTEARLTVCCCICTHNMSGVEAGEPKVNQEYGAQAATRLTRQHLKLRCD